MSHSAASKKRKVGKRRDFRQDNRLLRKRQKTSPNPTTKRTKKYREGKRKGWKRRKKKKKKGSQRTKDTSKIKQRRPGRHLLMTSFEPEEPSYDADDVEAPRLSLGHLEIAMDERDDSVVENFSESSAFHGDASYRSSHDDGSKVERANQAQIRGGQDCTDRGHPANIDAAKYLESAHCLRFSDLW